MRHPLIFLVWLCLGLNTARATPTFLFDATKAETAGNADWVVDEDNHVAGRYPTPPASGITASTPETYWTGALSSWGVALVQMGYHVEQLPVGGRITYGDGSNAQDLSNYQVYVVCEPNILFTAAEKSAMIRFVQAGGSLFVISDHAGSDRNNDGDDSVQIWNDFFTNNGVQANPFGVAINSTDISVVSTYHDTAGDDPLTNGALGTAAVLQFSDGATITLSTAANASVRAAFWSSATHTNSNAMAAWGSFGAGRFVVECDSSPPDDGTGSSGHTLYTGWTEEGVNHSRFFLNASVWLAGTASATTAPANDNFAHAAVLSGPTASASGTNVAATAESGEANPFSGGGHSVWWQWTAPENLTATVATGGSNFDTTLLVETGTAVNALTLVASNDDYAGSTSQVTFSALAGVTYAFRVDGYGSDTGSIALALTTQPVPTVSVAATTPQAAEFNQVSGVFTFTLTQAPANPLNVQITLTGTATYGVDYFAANVGYSGGQFMTISAGQTSAVVTILPVDDNDPTEGPETVIVHLLNGTGYQVNATAATATVTIQDDSPYTAAWFSQYRSAGFAGAAAAPLADPDGDGIPNLLEYAFNLNPLAADGPGALPVPGTALFADADGASRRFATLTFTRRTDAPGLAYAVETTTDLAANTWDATTAVFVAATSANRPANTEQAVYRAALPLDGPNAAPRQFLRVRVTSTSASATGNAVPARVRPVVQASVVAPAPARREPSR